MSTKWKRNLIRTLSIYGIILLLWLVCSIEDPQITKTCKLFLAGVSLIFLYTFTIEKTLQEKICRLVLKGSTMHTTIILHPSLKIYETNDISDAISFLVAHEFMKELKGNMITMYAITSKGRQIF
jgi:hypothetical protein